MIWFLCYIFGLNLQCFASWFWLDHLWAFLFYSIRAYLFTRIKASFTLIWNFIAFFGLNTFLVWFFIQIIMFLCMIKAFICIFLIFRCLIAGFQKVLRAWGFIEKSKIFTILVSAYSIWLMWDFYICLAFWNRVKKCLGWIVSVLSMAELGVFL